MDKDSKPQILPDKLISIKTAMDLPDFIVDLARVEWALQKVREDLDPFHQPIEIVMVNPTLALVPVSWKNLVTLLNAKSEDKPLIQASSDIHIIIWRHPKTGKLHIREAGDIDLLALKIIVERVAPKEAAAIGGVTVAAIESALNRAVSEGILISPESLIRRN